MDDNIKTVWRMETRTAEAVKGFYEVLGTEITLPPFEAVQDALSGNTEPLREWLKDNEDDDLGWNPPPEISISLHGEPVVTAYYVITKRFIRIAKDFIIVEYAAPGGAPTEKIMNNLPPGVNVEGSRAGPKDNYCGYRFDEL